MHGTPDTSIQIVVVLRNQVHIVKHVARVIVLFGLLVAYIIEFSFVEGFFIDLQNTKKCSRDRSDIKNKTRSMVKTKNFNYRNVKFFFC